ncbi:MAG: pyridoxal-phosphate-dependent aminotransferase family protein [Candidatus Bathyarchaeota archaeon]
MKRKEELLLMIPGPTNVPERIMKTLKKPMTNHRGPEFRSLYQGILEKLKYAFQTKNDVYPLTCSGTGGVEAAVGNVISRGDKVIVPMFGQFCERMGETVRRFGGEVIEVKAEWGSACSVEEIKAILDVEKNVKAVAVVYNETSTGVTLRSLPDIGKITRERGVLLIVDAVSVLLGDYLPVDEWNVDLCVAGSQKCFACPPGLAMVSVSEKAYEAAEKNKFRPFNHDFLLWREFKAKLETPFTPCIPLYYALDEALNILIEEGLENRIRRHITCAEAFYKTFENLNLKIVAKDELRSNTIIVPYIPENINVDEFRKILKERFRVVVAGGVGKLKGKVIRIGSMGVVSAYEVLATINGIIKTLKMLNYKPEKQFKKTVLEAKEVLSQLKDFKF